ncbi:conserved Plasmodium protein, unknown function [Plasmodium gallinaceum]|uniref:Uncharacterized protein n=1 Tax=Plasmodium gallinaceum TaxID=5849 RepID=A0A1J1GSV9_PLAGA|nr:conserved Plasmodium protein, unknown function [Plasmodium gallinaceum]CRG95336.1 conserved Plasmodium protein, unknown function [Plasmodium gallinaceum]
MFNIDLGKPEVDLTVCDYTDIQMYVSLLRYEYKFEPWSNDSRYLYSHENMQRIIKELNILMKSKIPSFSVFFISTFSYALMVTSYVGIFIFYIIEYDLFIAFLFSCLFLIAFVHYIMCMIYRYIVTKSVIESIEKRIKHLNKKYKDEQIYFKLINFSGLGFKYLKILPTFRGQKYFTLRVIYMYCKLI